MWCTHFCSILQLCSRAIFKKKNEPFKSNGSKVNVRGLVAADSNLNFLTVLNSKRIFFLNIPLEQSYRMLQKYIYTILVTTQLFDQNQHYNKLPKKGSNQKFPKNIFCSSLHQLYNQLLFGVKTQLVQEIQQPRCFLL